MPTTAPDNQTEAAVGKPIDRVDGRAKVTGRAMYAVEATAPGLVHGVLVSATIAKGRITAINTAAAEKSPGVLAVITHENVPKFDSKSAKVQAEKRLPLSDNEIAYADQYVAVVVADTFERARAAAMLVKPKYEASTPSIAIGGGGLFGADKPKTNQAGPLQFAKGDVAKAIADAPPLNRIEFRYGTPYETHNPIEMSGTVAVWDGDTKLTIYDTTQAVIGRRRLIAAVFGLKEENVRVICPFVGGGFGCKGDQWPHAVLAAAAAKAVGKPVRIMLTRQQMFTGVGHRPVTVQDISLAAAADGTITAVQHATFTTDSQVGHHVEPAGLGSSAVLYRTPNLAFTHDITRNNIGSATFMRAPGENPGTFALETAVDEMAYLLKTDPLEFRRLNYAKASPVSDKPYSSFNLPKAFDLGAEKFGWSKRPQQTGTLKTQGGKLIGYGMATAHYPAHRFPNQARIRLTPGEGGIKAIGQCATQDLGTGAYTVCTQMTSMLTGVPLERTRFELGDSTLPPGGVSGGSATTAGVGQALSEAADKLKANLIKYADGTPLAGMATGDVNLKGDKIVAKNDPTKSADIATLIQKSGRAYIEGQSDQSAHGADKLDEKEKKYTFHSFGCHFVEVQIDQPVPQIRVTRVVSVMDIGRVINPKTARSQVLGGVVMGIGQALFEETIYDSRTARPVNDNLADYLVPVNPDIHDIDVHFVGEPDLEFNAIGCRGVGEIGITGIAAAIGNAIYHATGKRLRSVPFTIDQLL